MMKLKNKLMALLMTAVLGTGCAMPLIGCSDGLGEGEERVDTSRTQIYTWEFGGATKNMAAIKARFEEAHKDDVYEEGKKGVQVMLGGTKTAFHTLSSQILSNREEIYFTEYAYYYNCMADGLVADITDAVTTPIGYGETKTIEDKLAPEQKDFFGIEQNGETHYYMLPHLLSLCGLVYNVDLFDEEGYYFAKTPSGNTLDDKFISKQNPKKSAGPDGIEDTMDDGLPVTYDQFFDLCEYMYRGGTTPVCWNGFAGKQYVLQLVQSLASQSDGLANSMLDYTFDGVADNLGRIKDGQFVLDDEPTTITAQNGYETARQAGKYYALTFIEDLIRNSKYHNTKAFNTAFTHINAQEDFLYAGHDGKTKPIGMLLDGTWWESEATATFDAMTSAKGQSFAKQNRRFAFMPLPFATQELADKAAAAPLAEKFTQYDQNYSVCFVKKNVASWKMPLINEFIKFIRTDESMCETTKISSYICSYDYDVSDDVDSYTYFGKSLYDIKSKSKIVYPYSSSEKYINNSDKFFFEERYWAKLGNITRQWPSERFNEESTTAEQWFEGMRKYCAENWGSLR